MSARWGFTIVAPTPRAPTSPMATHASAMGVLPATALCVKTPTSAYSEHIRAIRMQRVLTSQEDFLANATRALQEMALPAVTSTNAVMAVPTVTRMPIAPTHPARTSARANLDSKAMASTARTSTSAHLA